MEIAVLSDIHGNHIALERCLGYALARGAETFFFLGDNVGELAYPQKTLDALYGLKARHDCYFVQGNREQYFLEYRERGATGWQSGNSLTGTLWYVDRALRRRDLEFFAAMPPARQVEFCGLPPVTLCHGSPERVNGKLLAGDAESLEVLARSKTPLVLCGHTHVQGRIEHSGRTALNPGAVGVPLFSGGKAQFLLLHGGAGRWEEEFVSLKYDVERAIEELYEEGLQEHAPWWTAITVSLLRGKDVPHGRVLARAMELCRGGQGGCRWPEVPEEYMERAVTELIGAEEGKEAPQKS